MLILPYLIYNLWRGLLNFPLSFNSYEFFELTYKVGNCQFYTLS